MTDEPDRPLGGEKVEGKPAGTEGRAEEDRPAVRPPATVPDPAERTLGPIPPRSEALPPELPRAVRAFVMAGPPGSVSERTDARAAVPPSDVEHFPGDELTQRRASGEMGRLRSRIAAIEQENRELWAMLIEERRERAREYERMSRLVELARRNPPTPAPERS